MLNRIYIDTNVFINYYVYKFFSRDMIKNEKELIENVKSMNFLLSNSSNNLYVSTLSIAQITSILQKKKIKKDIIINEIKNIFCKFNIIDFTKKDINNVIENTKFEDIEDNFQFEMSKKLKCNYIITNNIKDFLYNNINIYKPKDVRLIFSFIRK